MESMQIQTNETFNIREDREKISTSYSALLKGHINTQQLCCNANDFLHHVLYADWMYWCIILFDYLFSVWDVDRNCAVFFPALVLQIYDLLSKMFNFLHTMHSYLFSTNFKSVIDYFLDLFLFILMCTETFICFSHFITLSIFACFFTQPWHDYDLHLSRNVGNITIYL